MKKLQRAISLGILCVLLSLLYSCARINQPAQIQKPDKINGKSLEAESIVTFFLVDGGKYITNHCYSMKPANLEITITATEPQGHVRWTYSGGNYNATQISPEIADKIFYNKFRFKGT